MKIFSILVAVAALITCHAEEFKLIDMNDVGNAAIMCAKNMSSTVIPGTEMSKDVYDACLIKCVIVKLGFYDNDKGFNIDRIQKQYDNKKYEKRLAEVFNECVVKDVTHSCSDVAEAYTCFMKKAVFRNH